MTATLTFVGTATTVLRLGPFTLLTDPNFLHRGQRAYLGKGLWSRRLTEPALTIEQLPTLDAVVLSHLHGDHFDRVARRGLPRDVPVLTTEPAARRLDGWGFTTQGLSTWEERELRRGDARLTVRAVPAVHAHGLMRRLLPEVMGSVLTLREPGRVLTVYVTGDTVTGDHLDRVGEAHPDIDVVVAHLGGTRVLLHTVTLDAPQGVDAMRRVGAPAVVGVHHSDYGVFRSPASRFVEAAARGLPGVPVVIPSPGETVDLDVVAGEVGLELPAQGVEHPAEDA